MTKKALHKFNITKKKKKLMSLSPYIGTLDLVLMWA